MSQYYAHYNLNNQGVIPFSSKYMIDPTISNQKHILNNMLNSMVNNNLPNNYCIKQNNRILRLNNMNDMFNDINAVCTLLDLERDKKLVQ